MSDLYFGWRSAILGLVAVQILVLAIAVLASPAPASSRRALSAALVVVAGLLVPYALGFAGAYDTWRGLTFAPFAIPLALGPFLWGYAGSLETGRWPRRFAWHLVPAALQFAYLGACFLLPSGPKWGWYTGGHQTWVAPVFDVLAPVSLALYAWAVGGVIRRYRDRLADQRSDDDRFAVGWLSRVRIAIVLGLGLEAGFWLWSVTTGGIDYFQETGLYLALGALGLYLGAAGWRHTLLPAPLAPDGSIHLPDETSQPQRPVPDWTVIGHEIAARTQAAGWWREPDLSLPRLARLLGTNTGRLSRAINLGLGVNFSVFINGLRADAVARALSERPIDDLLELALEMGFASKASFNRAFRDRHGITPSEYRRRVSDPEFSRATPIPGRARPRNAPG